MNALPFLRRPAVLWAASLALLALSGLQLRDQAAAVRAAKTHFLPIAAEIPALERRLRVLRQETEVGQLQAQLRTGSSEEKMRLYALPEGTGAPRALQLLDLLRDTLTTRSTLRTLSQVQVTDAAPPQELPDVAVRRLAFTATLNEEGLQSVLKTLSITGLVTVADALTSEQRRELTLAAERQNPASISSLGQFFATDLFTYARDPRAPEQRLLAAIPAEEFAAILRRAVASSQLKDAQQVLQGFVGDALFKEKLWPLPLLTLASLTVERGEEAGWVRASFVLQSYGRTTEGK